MARATTTLLQRGFWSFILSSPSTLFTFVKFVNIVVITDISNDHRHFCLGLKKLAGFRWVLAAEPLSITSPALTCLPPLGFPEPLHTAPAAHSAVLCSAQRARLAFAKEKYPWMLGMQKRSSSHAILQRWLQADEGAKGHLLGGSSELLRATGLAAAD